MHTSSMHTTYYARMHTTSVLYYELVAISRNKSN